MSELVSGASCRSDADSMTALGKKGNQIKRFDNRNKKK